MPSNRVVAKSCPSNSVTLSGIIIALLAASCASSRATTHGSDSTAASALDVTSATEPSASQDAETTPAAVPAPAANAAPVAAESGVPRTPAGWRFVIEPYFFLPFAINGDVTIGSREIPFNVTLSDLLPKFKFGAELHFEAWNGRFGLIADGTYLHVGQSGTLATVPDDWDGHMLIGNVLAGYRPIVAPIGSEGTISLELDAGGRIAWLDVNATIGGDSFSASRDFVRAVVGGRIPVRLSRHWVLGARGYATLPNTGWATLGWVELDPSKSVTILLGYKAEHFEWPGDQVSFSGTAHGPYVAVGFPFGAGNVY